MIDLDEFPMHRDARGTLIAAEFERLPFLPRRLFTVTGLEGGSDRGDHVIPCEQIMLLITGRADVLLGDGPDAFDEPIVLDVPGASVHLPTGRYIKYRLADEHSTVIVFAEQSYETRR